MRTIVFAVCTNDISTSLFVRGINMKALFAVTLALCFAATSMAAIEFSEDQVAASAADAVTTTETGGADQGDGGAGRSRHRSAAAVQAASAVVAAQASGAAGSAGTMNGVAEGVPAGEGGSSGGGGQNGDTGDNGNDEPEVDGGTTTGSAMSDPMALPEPSTAIVWSILAMCGLGAAVRFRRK